MIGYVKTHHRPMLAPEAWRQVPELSPGERSGLFAMRDDFYACYLRVGLPGPWAGPWAGIVRLEVPAGGGLALARATADAAARWLPAYASAPQPRRAGTGQHGAGRRAGTPPAPPAGRPPPGLARRTGGGAATQRRNNKQLTREFGDLIDLLEEIAAEDNEPRLNEWFGRTQGGTRRRSCAGCCACAAISGRW